MAPNYCTSVATESAYLEQLHVLQEAPEVLREMIAFCFPLRSGGALPQPAWGSLATQPESKLSIAPSTTRGTN